MKRKRNKKVLLASGVIVLLVVVVGGSVYEVKANEFKLPFLANIPLDKIPQDKLQGLTRMQEEVEKARSNPHNKPSVTGIPANLPKSLAPSTTPQAGIFNGGRDAFHPNELTVHNMWEGPVGSTWEYVYAGGTPENPASGNTTPVHGAIWMFIGAVGKNLKKFPAPNGTSPLTISGINGTVLLLRTDTGATLTFDLQTNQYK
jgi:hypothetical protein